MTPLGEFFFVASGLARSNFWFMRFAYFVTKVCLQVAISMILTFLIVSLISYLSAAYAVTKIENYNKFDIFDDTQESTTDDDDETDNDDDSDSDYEPEYSEDDETDDETDDDDDSEYEPEYSEDDETDDDNETDSDSEYEPEYSEDDDSDDDYDE